MKRVKAACICQTLHFMLKDDLEHSIAARLVREEVEHYKQALERNHTKHKIVDETTVSPTRCVLTALRAAEHGRKKVSKETFFSLRVRKPRYTPPVFWNLQSKFYQNVREAHERHAKGVPFLRPSGTPRTQSVRYLLPYSGKAGTGRTGAPQCAA